MIFATVGSQMPFDRLILALDNWSESKVEGVDILAQIGDSQQTFSHIKTVVSMPPEQFRAAVKNAQVIVAHAGMGSVLTAMEFGKPLVVMPRLGALQETRNDHQVATANWLAKKNGVYVAENELSLGVAIDRALTETRSTELIPSFASVELLSAIRKFIQS